MFESQTLCPLCCFCCLSADKPTINVTKLPKTIPVFNGYPEELVCEADGNPPPHIVWLRNSNKEPYASGSTLTVSEEGFFSCNATNSVGSVTHQVQVILKGKGTCTSNMYIHLGHAGEEYVHFILKYMYFIFGFRL